MINTSVNKKEHTVQSGVVDYPIGFPFYFNPDRTPQLLVKIGDEELRFNHNFELSEDKGSVVLRPTEEESWTLEGPEDFSWMTKWDGKDLLIERAVPFVQDSDYQLGRISSEQIERDFDLSVMRDQALDSKIKKLRNEVIDEFAATDSRLDSIQEQMDDEFRNVRDEFAEADKDLSDKIVETKTELQNSIDNIPDTYTKEELDAKFAEIPDSADTYTKEELDAKFAEIPEAVDAYTKAEVDAKLSSVYKFKGSVANVGELPTGAVVGDTYNVEDTGANYAWDGTKWDKLSDTIDLTDYATKEELSGYLPLSGGTVSGPLGTEDKLSIGLWKVSVVDNGSVLAISRGAAGRWLNFDYNSGAIYPMTLALSLGNSVTKWTNVFTKKLNNGADILIPTEGGTLARLEDLEGLGGGDYLPLSGGTLTGPLTIDVGATGAAFFSPLPILKLKAATKDLSYQVEKTICITPTGTLNMDGVTLGTCGSVLPIDNYVNLGSLTSYWHTVYVNEVRCHTIHNGADIAIPTAGGTMARLEDINAIGGDGTAGQVLTKTDTGMAWQDASGGTSLPDQTGNAGKVLTTDGTNASWTEMSGLIIRRL